MVPPKFICSLLLATISFSSKIDLNQTCAWNVVNGDGDSVVLDLKELRDLEVPIPCDLYFENSSSWWLYYTPCSNSVPCINVDNSLNETVMVSQITKKDLVCSAYLALFDGSSSNQPIYIGKNEGGADQYLFEYTNGLPSDNCANGRYVNITFLCDNNSTGAYNPGHVECKQLAYNNNTNVCDYQIIIPTKLACLTQSASSDNTLGGGWIVLILTGVIFILYCICGFCLNATKHSNWGDILGNLPNANIWCFCCYKNREYQNISNSNHLVQNNQTDNFEE